MVGAVVLFLVLVLRRIEHDPTAAAPLRFGRFELQLHERRLLVDGQPANLGARALDLLLALVTRSGRADEETGRTELLRSRALGVHAYSMASWLVSGAMCVVIGLLLTGVSIGGSLDPDGTVHGLSEMRKKVGNLLVVAADAPPTGLISEDVMLPFGRRLMEQVPDARIAATRHDPRIIVDLLMLAVRHRKLVLANAAIAYFAALLFAFAPFWLGRRTDLGSYEVGVVLFLALSSLGLRAMPTTANEVDEE